MRSNPAHLFIFIFQTEIIIRFNLNVSISYSHSTDLKSLLGLLFKNIIIIANVPNLFMHIIKRNLRFQVRFLQNRHSWIQNLMNKRVTNCQNFVFWKDPCALTVTQWTSPEPNTHARNNRAHIHYYDQ